MNASGINIVDLSNRRGAIIRLRTQIYELLKETLGGPYTSFPNYVTWNQQFSKELVDARRKWLFALDETARFVYGLMFYRLAEDGALYLNHMAIRQGAGDFIKKFEQDDSAKTATKIFFSRHIKKITSEEILEGKGMSNDSVYNSDGYQLIGDITEAVKELQKRYVL